MSRSKRKVYLAIDVHARHCELGCMDSRGNYHGSVNFVTSETELIKHVTAIDAKTKIITFEEGPLAYWVSRTLTPHVTEVLIADSREIPLVSHNKNKRDKIDVRNLCRLLRLGELHTVYHPEDDTRAVFKAAVQHYLDLRDEQTQVKQKIKAKYRSWGVLKVGSKTVFHATKRFHYLKQIKSRAIRHQLERLYYLLDAAETAQAGALREARRLGNRYPEIQEFLKIPGVGPVGALVFDAYIQTPDRFATKSRLYRYCKLAVASRSSDGKPLSYKRLDQAGNSELKAMSYRAVLCARNMIADNEVKQYYNRSLAHSHNETHARLNSQRKLISVMHGVWRRKEEYRPELFLGSR